jgi:maltose alpha-D-glucosyltransferase/alpha-amylase
MIQVRKGQPALRRGDTRFVDSPNRAILVYERVMGDSAVLVANNLSPSQETTRLDLKEFAGACPLDLFSGERLAVVSDSPLRIDLERYGFRWLLLESCAGTSS